MPPLTFEEVSQTLFYFGNQDEGEHNLTMVHFEGTNLSKMMKPEPFFADEKVLNKEAFSIKHLQLFNSNT